MPETRAPRTAAQGRAAGSPRARLAALVLAAAFSFTGLSNHPLRASDEPRVAGIAWEMQQPESSLVPHLGGEPFLEHPPLFYAVLGGFIRSFGATEGVARLPGAIASAATLLLVFALGSRLASPRAGLAALLALVCMRGFFRYSHKVLVDPLLMLCVLTAFYGYVRFVWAAPDRERGAAATGSAGWLLLVYLGAALAFYVKGFVGVVAVAGPAAVDALAGLRVRALRSPAHLAGLPLLALVCASWPWWLQQHGSDAAVRDFLVHNGLYRIFPGAGVYTGGHEHAWWYYLPRIPEQVGWPLVFVPAAAAWLWRGEAPASWNLPAIRFLALVLPVGAALLSIPGTKRGLYLLPFLPPLAVAIGAWLAGAAHPAFQSTACRVQRVAAAWGPRLLAIGFAVSLAWNLVAYPFVGSRRDLGPVARGVDARVGSAALAGFRLPEEMRGALPFYSGRIALAFRDPAELARYLERRESRFVLAPSGTEAEIATLLGGSLVPAWTWRGAERGYTLYTDPPPLGSAARSHPLPRSGMRLEDTP